MSIWQRLLAAIGRVLSAFFNICIKLKYVLVLVILLVAGCIGVTYNRMINAVGGKADYDEAMRYIEIKDLVDEYFIDPADRTAMGNSAAAAMISGLGDKWSYYMSADEYRTYQLYSTNEYSSIGMSIMQDANGGGYQVIAVNPDTPAAKAGITSGMVITAIDGESVKGQDIDSVRTKIRSRMNTQFIVEVGGRDEYTVDCTKNYVSPVTYRMEKTEAGYVKIDNFEAGSGQDAINAVETLLSQGATALVIDLRGNAGGLAAETRTFLDYLLPGGTLFESVDKAGNKVRYESDNVCIQLPMCVLINAETHAEAEVFAAVMKEFQAASLVGEATTGDTRTQSTIEISDGSAMRISTGSYLTAGGTDISKAGGVIPDRIIYNSDSSATGTTSGTVGESDGTAVSSNDEQLVAALTMLSMTNLS